MSRKQRERKLTRLEEIAAEKAAAELRRKERMAPVIKFTKKAMLTIVGTLFVLFVGLYVSNNLHEIGRRLLHR